MVPHENEAVLYLVRQINYYYRVVASESLEIKNNTRKQL